MAEAKTNAQRMLERDKINYTAHSYDVADGLTDGVSVARKIGVAEERVFKTLVTRGASGGVCVFVIPVAGALDLKAAARAAGEKAVAMIPVGDITPLTGYVKGGCSPVGMKKRYPTVIDESASAQPSMVVSAGRVGAQVELLPEDLRRATGGHFAPLIRQE